MTAQLLTRHSRSRRIAPHQTLLGETSLRLARAHEFCGNARRTLAMVAASATTGPVFWITPGWMSDRLNPQGMLRFADPARFTFLNPRRAEDLLWCMEEILRSGAIPLVVADLPAPPALTPVRRLHLAAETGAAEGKFHPLGLLLTPGDGGAQGVESRWHMTGAHEADSTGWILSRTRARTDPVKTWSVKPKGASLHLTEHHQKVSEKPTTSS